MDLYQPRLPIEEVIRRIPMEAEAPGIDADGTGTIYGPPSPYKRQTATHDTFRPSPDVVIPARDSLYDHALQEKATFPNFSVVDGANTTPLQGSARGAVGPRDASIKSPQQQQLESRVLFLPGAEQNSPAIVPREVFSRLTPSKFASPPLRRRLPVPPVDKDNDVLVCADCLQPVQDAATPPCCSVSGKKHF